MKAIEGVLPASPDIQEIVLAKDQPEYLPLPVALLVYSNGVMPMISRYRLSFYERLRVLFTGDLWIEQLTFGNPLQPQRPTVFEPLTQKDNEYSKACETARA